jgi:hypothetical protein
MALMKYMFYQIRLRKFSISLTFILLVVILIASCSPWLHHESEFNNFESLNCILESNKRNFSIGDQIVLTARITSDKPAKIRMYKDRKKAFKIHIRRWLKNDVDFSDDDFSLGFFPIIGGEEIEVIHINLNSPFQFQVEGVFEADKQGGYSFNFNKFGKLKKQKLGEFSIASEWRNLDPIPAQSEEEIYTNLLTINVGVGAK